MLFILKKSFFSFVMFLILVSSTSIYAQIGTNDDLNKLNSYLTIAQAKAKLTAAEYDEHKEKRLKLEEQLLEIEAEITPSNKEKKKQLEAQLKNAKKREKVLLQNQKDANSKLVEISSISSMSAKKRHAKILELESKEKKANQAQQDSEIADPDIATNTPSDQMQAPKEVKPPVPTYATPAKQEIQIVLPPPANTLSNSPPESLDPDVQLVSEKPKSKNKKETKLESKKVATANKKIQEAKQDVIVNPPVPECQFDFRGKDEMTGKIKKETPSYLLFSHTEEFMKPNMKDRDYITCQVQAASIEGGYRFVNFDFTIATPEAQKSFGFLDKGSQIILKLMNGKAVTLQSTKTDIGIPDNALGITKYKAQCRLTASEMKTIAESELDFVRVAWSAGYEDYEIFGVDLLINMIKCLEK
jgi:hypothetical protein